MRRVLYGKIEATAGNGLLAVFSARVMSGDASLVRRGCTSGSHVSRNDTRSLRRLCLNAGDSGLYSTVR